MENNVFYYANNSDDEIIRGAHDQGRHQNQNQELRGAHDSGTRSGLDTSRSASFRDVSHRSSRCKLGDWDLSAVTIEAYKRVGKRGESPLSRVAFVAWDHTRGPKEKRKRGKEDEWVASALRLTRIAAIRSITSSRRARLPAREVVVVFKSCMQTV